MLQHVIGSLLTHLQPLHANIAKTTVQQQLVCHRDVQNPMASWGIEADPNPKPGSPPVYTLVSAADAQQMQVALLGITQGASKGSKSDDRSRDVTPISQGTKTGALMHHQVHLCDVIVQARCRQPTSCFTGQDYVCKVCSTQHC